MTITTTTTNTTLLRNYFRVLQYLPTKVIPISMMLKEHHKESPLEEKDFVPVLCTNQT